MTSRAENTQYPVIAATTNEGKVNWLTNGIVGIESENAAPIALAGIKDKALLDGVEGGQYEADRAFVKAQEVTNQTGYRALGWDIGLDIPALGEANPGPNVHKMVRDGLHLDREPTNEETLHFYQERLMRLPPEKRKGTIKHAFALTTPEGITYFTTHRIPVTYHPEKAELVPGNNPLVSMMRLEGYDKVFSELSEEELKSYYSRLASPVNALVNEAIAHSEGRDTRRSNQMGDRVWVFSDPLFHLYTEADKAGADKLASALSAYYDGHKEGWATELYGVARGDGRDENGHHSLRRNMLLYGEVGDPKAMCSLVDKRGGAVKFNTFATDETIRGAGYGSKLLREVDDMMEALGVRKIFATTANRVALHLFNKHGYQIEAVYPRHYSKRHDEYVVGKIYRGSGSSSPIDASQGMCLTDETASTVERIEFMNGKGDPTEIQHLLDRLGIWHDDVGPDYATQTMKGADNGFGNISKKGKLVVVARMPDGNIGGVLVACLKLGGPTKLYPLAGTQIAQQTLLEAAIIEAERLGSHVVYTFSPVGDEAEAEFLLSVGFEPRGELRSPYKDGRNLIPWTKHINGFDPTHEAL